MTQLKEDLDQLKDQRQSLSNDNKELSSKVEQLQQRNTWVVVNQTGFQS